MAFKASELTHPFQVMSPQRQISMSYQDPYDYNHEKYHQAPPSPILYGVEYNSQTPMQQQPMFT